MLTRTADEWEAYLQSQHVPAARVRRMEEALADPHLASRGVVHRFEGGAPGVPQSLRRAGRRLHPRAWRAAGGQPAADGRAAYRRGAGRVGIQFGGDRRVS